MRINCTLIKFVHEHAVFRLSRVLKLNLTRLSSIIYTFFVIANLTVDNNELKITYHHNSQQ